jgi:hypothetical protein
VVVCYYYYKYYQYYYCCVCVCVCVCMFVCVCVCFDRAQADSERFQELELRLKGLEEELRKKNAISPRRVTTRGWMQDAAVDLAWPEGGLYLGIDVNRYTEEEQAFQKKRDK